MIDNYNEFVTMYKHIFNGDLKYLNIIDDDDDDG